MAKSRPFRFSVKPNAKLLDCLLVEVDNETGEMTWGPPLSNEALANVTSQGFLAKLDNPALTKLVILSLTETSRLRGRVAELEELQRRLGDDR